MREGVWRLSWAFDMLIAATGSHMSLLPEQGKWFLLADGNQFHKLLRNAGFYLMARNPIVHLKLVSGDTDSLLESEELEFSLDDDVYSYKIRAMSQSPQQGRELRGG